MKSKFVPPKNLLIGIVGNIAKPSTCETACALIGILEERKIKFTVQHEIAAQMKTKCNYDAGKSSMQYSEIASCSDIIVSLGGDGTILRTAKLVGGSGKPILGINLGKLGFLAELNFDELRNSIDELFKGKFNLEERATLQASFEKDGKSSTIFALNDIVIDKAGSSRMIDLETYVDSEYLITYRADGIVISTPTGSTGYSLSTGGPIISPESRVIAISPISPHTLTARPVIVPDDSEIRIVVRSASQPMGEKQIMVSADGQTSQVLTQPAELKVSLAPYRIKLLRKSKNGFFNLLRTKLMWGVDIRADQ
ncbi:MAG TPA: NAD(+)/NADH kinase [Candidatus Acidoferrales bacterium]|nr:NAD(+)/NADH kinase [Candidatus Acidoferrales bacterium]